MLDPIAKSQAKNLAIQYAAANFQDMSFKSRDDIKGTSTYTMTFIKDGKPFNYDVELKDGKEGKEGKAGQNGKDGTGEIATEQEAIGGTENTKVMTPLRVSQSMETLKAAGIKLDITKFKSLLKDYDSDNAQSLFNYIDKLEEIPLGIFYVGEKGEIDSWEVKKVGQGLAFSRFQNGKYELIYTIENSATTDNYFINCPEGRLAYVTADKKIHTLIKSSTDLKGCQINNVDGRISLMNNGTIASYCPTGEVQKIDINNITEEEGIKNAYFIISYEQHVKISDNVLLFGVNEYYAVLPDEGMTVRVYITDKETGNLLAQSCSLGQFYGGKGTPVVNGVNKVDFTEAFPVLEGKEIILRADFADATEIQGIHKKLDGDTEERFYIRFNTLVQHLKEENVATREWVAENPWDMNVDLNKGENIEVSSQGDIKYAHLHDIPFKRERDWIPNEYIFIEGHNPAEDISACTYFVLKAKEPYIENYTDLSVKFRLSIEEEDGNIVNIDCLASTGIGNIYNKISTPILMTSRVILLCNCLENPNGYLPNDIFEVGFYTSTGSESATTQLFDSKTGLVNEAILPSSSGNKFNEIKLYDVPDESYPRGTKTPTISYDSANFGYTPILGANSGKGMGITLGNIMSEFDIMTNKKNGLRTWYLEKSVEMGIGEESSELPMEGTVWTRKFATQPDINAVIGFVFLSGVGTKINIKMTSMLNEKVVVNKDFSFDKVKEPASPSYAIVSNGVSGFTEVNQGDYELKITLISGSLYGVDFPYCTAVMGKLSSDYLANRSTLVSETITKTNVSSFIMDAVNKNKIIGFEDVNEIPCDKIVIPKFSSISFGINSIGDNVFGYYAMSGKPIYIYAQIAEIGIGNFKDDSGNQLDIHISPNNTETWKVFESMGYKITPMDLPTSNTKQSVLKNDKNGVIDWVQDEFRDGCVYLSPKNRIKSVDGEGFIFEVLTGTVWSEVTRFMI